VNSGLGCILAHSMGLGKTVQVIAFVDVFLRHTDARCVLIIVPVNTLQNWVAEFDMWLPVSQSPLGRCSTRDSDNIWPRSFSLYILNENMKTNAARAKVVCKYGFLCPYLHCESEKDVAVLLRATLLNADNSSNVLSIKVISTFVIVITKCVTTS